MPGTDANTAIAHGNGQMRAQSFSIQVSTRCHCNISCEFCISRTTPNACSGFEPDEEAGTIEICNDRRLRIGLNYAKQLGASHAILTGKADPTQEKDDYICEMIQTCGQYLPLVDMHTNGLLMLPGMRKENLLPRLVEAGLTMITFSIASFDPATNHNLMHIKRSAADLIEQARKEGLMVRCSLVVNAQGVANLQGILEYVRSAGELGAHMVVIREVWVPDSYQAANHTVFEWNQANKVPISPLQDQMRANCTAGNAFGLSERDPLPWGTPVFVMGGNMFSNPDHGVNITFACCDEATTGNVLKSIVHKPDGHGYRNWDHNGDILY